MTSTTTNLNFDVPSLIPNSYQYIFTSSSYTPIEGWTITAPLITLMNEQGEEEPIQYVSFLLGNGTGGPFHFSAPDTIPSSFSQYGIIQFSGNCFDGITRQIVLSCDVEVSVAGDYLLTYYVQARSPHRGISKYTEQHTLQVSLNNYSTADLSLGDAVGVWKKQELPLTITTTGTYPLSFTSRLHDVTGFADSTLVFGSIVLEPV